MAVQIKEKQEEKKIENETKAEICQLIIFFFNKRIDYLVDNFLTFFDQIGVQKIDNKYQSINIQKNNIFLKIIQFCFKQTKYGIYNKIQFQDFTGNQFPDLDNILQKKNNNTKSKNFILPSLFMIFYLTNDNKLEEILLEIILKLFSQQKIFIQNLKTIQVLFDKSEIHPYKVKKQINFNIIKKSYYKIVYQISKISLKILQKNQDNKQIIIIPSDFYQNYIIKYTTSQYSFTSYQTYMQFLDLYFTQIDKNRQKTFSFQEGHIPIINLIKQCQNHLTKYLKQQQNINNSLNIQSLQTKQIQILVLLRTLYQILICFAVHNEENQQILQKQIPLFMDEIAFDFGQIDLLTSIYINNKLLCESFSETNFKQVQNSINEYGRQPRFLQILSIIQKIKIQEQKKDYFLTENQIKIFNWLLPNQFTEKEEYKKYDKLLFGQTEYKKLCLRFDLSLELEFYKNSQNIILSNFLKKSTQNFNFQIDIPFQYHAVLVDLFLLSIQGEEGFSINVQKIKNVFPLDYVFSILCEKDDLLNTHNEEEISQKNMLQNNQYSIFYEDIQQNEENINNNSFSVLKPKILDLVTKTYFNKNLPMIESITKYKEILIKFLKQEIERFILFFKKNATLPSLYSQFFFNYFLPFSQSYLLYIINKEAPLQEDKIQREDFILLETLAITITQQVHNDYFQQISSFISLINPSLNFQIQNNQNTSLQKPYNFFSNIKEILPEEITKIYQIQPVEVTKNKNKKNKKKNSTLTIFLPKQIIKPGYHPKTTKYQQNNQDSLPKQNQYKNPKRKNLLNPQRKSKISLKIKFFLKISSRKSYNTFLNLQKTTLKFPQ
ncbi:MIR domain protein [Ichthyophthirius multifiliis]|uniref:MIR domain protein n=1 Tax=Ichthyophthirius multifiliis TaxID=5932 RepID=G0R2I1_ICHMU|nr:MIR domain protein [Ichthyophthirius multifiliis]EGR28322.1 MIR domain protein [Ichthyophthirius multifiliis]|eukprot:XP_004027667.1 MIR domain protein [Ichthyophthirius multifiliis]